MSIKRIIAVILILSMILSVTTALAATESEPSEINSEHKILFSDDFNKGILNWSSNSKDYFTGNTGRLVYNNIIGNNFDHYIVNDEFVLSNGYVQFDMRANSPVGFSAMLRVNGETAIFVSFDYKLNKVRITKVVGGGKEIFLSEGKFKFTNKTLYSVNIALSGSDITVKINDAEITKATDNEIKKGYVGFTAKKGRYEIDNLLIYY